MPMGDSRASVEALIGFFENKSAAMGGQIVGTRRRKQPDTAVDNGPAARKKRKLDTSTSTAQEFKLKRSDSAHSTHLDDNNSPRNDPPASFPSDLTPYLTFARHQPEALATPLATLRTLILCASMIGNSTALISLQRTLFLWRSRTAPSGLSARYYAPDTSSSLASPTARFQYHYRRMECANTSVNAAITRRYASARMREALDEYTASCDSGSGRREGEVLRELFGLVHPRAAAGSAAMGLKWNMFRRAVRAGRRWKALEERFSCGVFALLPSTVSCAYVERELGEGLFDVWCRVLGKWPVIRYMAGLAEEVVRRLAEDLPPMEERLWLEGEEVPARATADGELAGLLEECDEGVWGGEGGGEGEGEEEEEGERHCDGGGDGDDDGNDDSAWFI